ncbi:MAG: SpoIID/LytB domain-containing protein [bacterium]
MSLTRKIIIFNILIILAGVLSQCAPPGKPSLAPEEESMGRPRKIPVDTLEPVIHPRRVEKARRRDLTGPDPIVRVGVMEEYDRIEFSVQGPFDIISQGGAIILSEEESEDRFRVFPDETQEARVNFSILVTAFADRDSAEEVKEHLAMKGHPARIAEIGDAVYMNGKLIAFNVKYRVLVGRYLLEREAKPHLEDFKRDFAPRIIRQVIKPATGTLSLINLSNNQKITLNDGFRIIPRSPETRITLYNVREGTGYHWEREVDRQYRGIVEVRIDHRALLMAFVELPLEVYLQGVVPSEMSPQFPLEALKAQAIAARSEVFAKMGAKHPNDPFDLCAHVHCQAYTGCTQEDPRTTQAVEETRGMVLTQNNLVVEAVYSSMCGGHTENKINVWNPPAADHLTGVWDSNHPHETFAQLDLRRETDLERWVQLKPDVYCNTANNPDLPYYLQRTEENFRWEVTYSRQELESIIKRKTGEDIGELVDIVPLQRGVSGRLMEIEIIGTQKTLRIQRELNIRSALALRYLKSACFAISYETDDQGRPILFHLKGAGWGHGVGMCQVGAAVMAFQGKTYDQILQHYYPHTQISKIY